MNSSNPISDHTGIIYNKAKELVGKYGYTRDDLDDIFQDLNLDILKSIPRFDPEKSTMKTFIVRVMNRRVARLIRDKNRLKRDCRREEFSIDALIDERQDDDVDEIPRCLVVEDSSHLDLDVSLVLADLPPELQEAAELLKNHEVNGAARELGIHRATLYRTLFSDLFLAFKKKGLDEYL